MGKKHCLHTVGDTIEEQGLITSSHTDQDQCSTVEVAILQGTRFTAEYPVQLDDIPCTLQQAQEHYVVLQLPKGAPLPQQEECNITQTKQYYHIDDVFQQLNQYWKPFWQRESQHDHMSDEDTQELQHMLTYLPSDIPQLDIDTKDIDQWMYIIKTTKSNSAPGADGIHACELQMLPKAAIQNLVLG